MENKDLETIFYNRIDLSEVDKNKKIKDIHIGDFRYCSDIWKSDLWIFVDDDFTTKILKSRFTENGIVKNNRKKKNIFNFFRF